VILADLLHDDPDRLRSELRVRFTVALILSGVDHDTGIDEGLVLATRWWRSIHHAAVSINVGHA
jgi:hypothetical protein